MSSGFVFRVKQYFDKLNKLIFQLLNFGVINILYLFPACLVLYETILKICLRSLVCFTCISDTIFFISFSDSRFPFGLSGLHIFIKSLCRHPSD